MNRYLQGSLLFAVVLSFAGELAAQRQAVQAPRTFLLNGEKIAAIKQAPSAEVVGVLRTEADKAMRLPRLTVVDKAVLPPDGDKHSYLSVGRYFWPNPDTKDHLPYLYRDGVSNPEVAKIKDHDDLARMCTAVRALALAGYVTGDAKYSERAATMLRTWFLDPATLMHPNMKFGQSRPGSPQLSHSGVLDSRPFTSVVDAVGLLQGSAAWKPADQAGMIAWFREYYEWLTTSELGKAEAAEPNNHGSWEVSQEIAVALFLGKDDDAKKLALRVKDHRLPSQLDAKGWQPEEDKRTNSFFYSAFNLEALSKIALFSRHVGVELWSHEPGRGNMKTSLDLLVGYATNGEKWPYQQIAGPEPHTLCPVLANSQELDPSGDYTASFDRLGCAKTADLLIATFHPPAQKRP